MREQTLHQAVQLFGLQQHKLEPVEAHEGGQNLLFRCRNPEGRTSYLRLSCRADRCLEDYQSETEFVHYLVQNGAPVADALPSVNGNLTEQLQTDQGPVFVTLFEEAVGEQLATRGYQYRKGAPLAEYFYNCGRCLGQIHALSRRYEPDHPRFDYTRSFNMEHFAQIIPAPYATALPAIERILNRIALLRKDSHNYGIVHFDFSDGNYMIDYSNGDIHVFDFDNCCRCWYLYDLANLWIHGVGWFQFEPDAQKRRAFMDAYFSEVLRGYRSAATIDNEELTHLQDMIQLVLLENLMDEFDQADEEDDEEEDEEILYRLKCLTENIPYYGFFSNIYTPEHPFSL